MIERRGLGPHPAQQADIFARTVVAFNLGLVIAIGLRFFVAGGGDDVHPHPPRHQPVKRGQHARGHRWRDKARAVRQHHAQTLGLRRHKACNREVIGHDRGIGDEHLVIAPFIMQPRHPCDAFRFEGIERQRVRLARYVVV